MRFCSGKDPRAYISREKRFGCNNYAPMEAVIARGRGAEVWDVTGKRYLDFLSAYSAVNQGHVHPRILEVFVKQASQLTLTSRAVYNDRLGHVEEKLTGLFGYDKVIMMNSGVEAGETAIKFARRWGYAVKKVKPDSAAVLFAEGNFWGRTIAACASSDDPQRYTDFGPFKGLNFDLVKYGCPLALEAKFKANPNIVAYMVEPIQGERGVVIPPEGYLGKVKSLCEQYGVLLITDEIQTGLGRTGKLLCSEHDGVRPDMVLLGKALSGGFYPVSAVLADNEIMDLIQPGDHGSTYGGSPLASAVALEALEVIVSEKMSENSARLGARLLADLKRIVSGPRVRDVRGRGLFLGLEFEGAQLASQFSSDLLDLGLLAKPTHANIIRFSPPLVLSDSQLTEATSIIEKAWIRTLRAV